MHFKYTEDGNAKQALVICRVCVRCAFKLNYDALRKETHREAMRERLQLRQQRLEQRLRRLEKQSRSQEKGRKESSLPGGARVTLRSSSEGWTALDGYPPAQTEALAAVLAGASAEASLATAIIANAGAAA
ncbi:hypothetical protein cyc_06810 [Cyclospora cayetanensis]|uniref:Uncharacterized protein n=1 Tax=Cyclospora cayetanensis TaxID=88456 RepID=A0A1D3CXS1_9EIME|nr:hypothetical protein cyc_06810 [Cyclospora cayetanensis]